MKKRYTNFIILSLLFLSFACTNHDGNEKKEITEVEYYFPGTNIVRSHFEVENKKFNGLGIEYFKSGKVKTKGQYKRNKKEDEHFEYYESGKVKSHEWYKEGGKDGLNKQFDSNGILLVEENYANGNKEGALKYFNEAGKVLQHFNYKNGKLDGEQKTYYPNENLKSIYYYQNGFMGVGLKEYEENGNLINQGVEIQVQHLNQIIFNREYSLLLSLKGNKKGVFYIEDDVKNDYLITNMVFKVPTKNGKTIHKINLGGKSFIMTKLAVFVKTSSKLGNDLVEKKIVTIAANM